MHNYYQNYSQIRYITSFTLDIIKLDILTLFSKYIVY